MVRKRFKKFDRTLNKEEIKELINDTKRSVKMEIKQHLQGRGTEGNIKQLNIIYNQLSLMEEALNTNKFKPTYSRIIIDSWDFNSKLGLKLLDLIEIYNKVCKL